MGKASKDIPTLRYGNKIYPEDLAGMIGQPVVGNIFYVDANAGSDTANNGTEFNKAFKTLGTAYAACTSFNYDVIIVAPSANAVTTEASITWSKSYITVVGATAPVYIGPRARIGWGTSATSPCLAISGMGNRFINLKLVVEEDVNVLVSITGERNYFANVNFAGICNTTTGDDTAARCVTITDAGENYFLGCAFGVNTVLNSAANALVELNGANSVARTKFEDCLFDIVCDNAGPRFVLFTGAYSSECWTWFKDCMFLNTRGGTTTMTVGITVPASVNGRIILDNSWFLGVTDISSIVTHTYMNNNAVATPDAGLLIVSANT